MERLQNSTIGKRNVALNSFGSFKAYVLCSFEEYQSLIKLYTTNGRPRRSN